MATGAAPSRLSYNQACSRIPVGPKISTQSEGRPTASELALVSPLPVTDQLVLQRADIFFTRGTGLLSRLIRFFTRGIPVGEESFLFDSTVFVGAR